MGYKNGLSDNTKIKIRQSCECLERISRYLFSCIIFENYLSLDPIIAIDKEISQNFSKRNISIDGFHKPIIIFKTIEAKERFS